MEKQKKSTGRTMLIVFLLLVTIVAIILATYAWAKYTSSISGEANAQVAKWDVQFSGNETTIQSSDYVKVGHLAPGIGGQYTVALNSENTEVAYDYTVGIANLANKPTNLKFYSKRTGTGTAEDPYVYSNEISKANYGELIKGSVTLDSDGKATVFGDIKDAQGNVITGTPAIYWNWAFETTTAVTELADSEAMKTALTKLATEKGASAEELAAATTALALATLANTKGATWTEVNNVIDTVEGENASSESVMTFNALCTAVQKDPNEQ